MPLDEYNADFPLDPHERINTASDIRPNPGQPDFTQPQAKG